MSELQHTFERLIRVPMFKAERPATKEEIRHIEADLGVVLPEQYKEFLSRFGYVGGFGQQILGIRPLDHVTGRPSTVISDCVARTKSEKDPRNPFGTSRLPRDHVVIATDGGGGNFVLFAVGSPCEGEVHWYNFEDMADPVKVWKTFKDYLEYEIENALREA